LDRSSIEEILGIGKTRFFALLKRYRLEPNNFSLTHQRFSPSKVSPSVEEEIKKELLIEKKLIEDHTLPISNYNLTIPAIRDRLLKKGITVSLLTIIDRAKKLGCYHQHFKRKSMVVK
jgi:hypothetical protein